MLILSFCAAHAARFLSWAAFVVLSGRIDQPLPTSDMSSYNASDLIADLRNHLIESQVAREADLPDSENTIKAGAEITISALKRYTSLLSALPLAMKALLNAPGAKDAIGAMTPEERQALQHVCAAPHLRAGGPFLKSEHYTHCFVGSKESTTRWVASLDSDPIHLLAAQVEVFGKWVDLHPSEMDDLAEDINQNQVRLDPEDLNAEWTSVWPEWAGAAPANEGEGTDLVAALNVALAVDSNQQSDARARPRDRG